MEDTEKARRGEPMFDLPAVLVGLVALLAGIQLLRDFLPIPTDNWILELFAFVPDRLILENGVPAYDGGWGAVVWTFLTYAFLHGGWSHLLLNAVMLAAVGRLVIARFGTARFLALLAVSAVAGAAVHLAAAWGSDAPMIGASGVVFGVLGAALRFAFVPPWMPIPSAIAAFRLSRVRGFVLALVVMNLILVVFGAAPFGGGEGDVAWAAHLGGFLAGYLGFRLFDPPRRAPSRPWQV